MRFRLSPPPRPQRVSPLRLAAANVMQRLKEAEPLMGGETYLIGNWETGAAALQCERKECRVPGNCASGSCFWTEDLPHHATIQDALEAYERHIATHKEATK